MLWAMRSSIKFLHNFLAVAVLFVIIGASALATLSLSPISIISQEVAGESTVAGSVSGIILSNLIPLTFTDLNQNPSNEYFSQLVGIETRTLIYNIRFDASSDYTGQYPFIEVRNDNSVPVSVSFSPHVSGDHASLFHLAVRNGNDLYRVHDGATQSSRHISLELQPGETRQLEVEFSKLKSSFLPVEVAIELSY